ncbi:hypothetical protein, partial [Candidatus Protochlamydia sp. W-9]|uniref:hypothetical protein n=1 Tax=Candidatus Protochlamydia sp. W-9 TaxID=1785087 RepID=UPI001D045E64
PELIIYNLHYLKVVLYVRHLHASHKLYCLLAHCLSYTVKTISHRSRRSLFLRVLFFNVYCGRDY